MALLSATEQIATTTTTETLHAHLPNRQITVLPGQQHSAMLTAPELFASEMAKFLK